MDTNDNLRDFLTIPYDELETLNLKAKKRALKREPISKVRKYYSDYLKAEKRIKAVTICFTDIEGRFHMLDYDKKFFLDSYMSLTFDGSSVRGFASLEKSDLAVTPDWYSFRWLPSDVFGQGKVLMFGYIVDQHGDLYESDMRSRLHSYLDDLYKKKKIDVNISSEIEGVIVRDKRAEQNYDEKDGFKLVTEGGYFHALPTDKLKQFIDKSAEAQRVLGFENEKDHPEVAPSSFELNFKYTDALLACDQIQLYKLVCRQVAHNMSLTATFLPKPVVGINGNGMHINISLAKAGKNLFYSKGGELGLSALAWSFTSKILNHANGLCLILNASVNAYRRLDPNYEAPNQIRHSATDRGAMIRIPLANNNSTRLEIRSVGPDANPYLAVYSLIKTGFEGEDLVRDKNKRPRMRILPGTITDAIRYFKGSGFVTELLGEEVKTKYLKRKEAVAHRSARELGSKIKNGEILYHHEVTNQLLWKKF